MTASLRPPVRYRLLQSLEEFRQTVRIQRATWGSAEIVPPEVMVASSHAGGFVLGALQGRRVVGFAYALAGWQGRTRIFWSHMLAVEPRLRDAGIGERLKWLQRRHALRQGVHLIRWSFDPLEGRNAWLNLHKLGCVAMEYIPNLYGRMASKLEGGLETDRLIASWFLGLSRVWRLARPVKEASPRLKGAPLAEVLRAPMINETRFVGGVLRCGRLHLDHRGRTIRIEIPSPIQPIKQKHRAVAKEWRMKIRRAFIHYLLRGYVAVYFWRGEIQGRRKSFYVLVRGEFAAFQRRSETASKGLEE